MRSFGLDISDKSRTWNNRLGYPSWLVTIYHKFCILGRNRTRRHPYFSDSSPFANEMANGNFTLIGSNDSLCSYDGGTVSACPLGKALGFLLYNSISLAEAIVAELYKPACMGCMRSRYISDSQHNLLAGRIDS